jgi:hypothetical protein
MKKSKWPDFLFTLGVRFVCGVLLGGLVCFLLTWKGILRAFSHDHVYSPFIWLGVCGLIGGIAMAFTIPRWQTPWYQRDSETTDLLNELTRAGSGATKSISISTVDEDGQRQEYSSMEAVPPELRSEIEALEKEAAQQASNETPLIQTSKKGSIVTKTLTRKKSLSVYKITDESGAEQTYHSLEEIPPELRAAIEEAEKKSRK